MRRLSPNLAPIGYSPRRYLPLSPAPVIGMGEAMTDLRDLQAMFANGELGGYWPADPRYSFEDSPGTTAASVNGVVGLRYDVGRGASAETRRNLANYSEIISEWMDVSSAFTLTENNGVAPDGTTTADLINVGGFGYQKVYPLVPSNRTYTFSGYLWTLAGKATIGIRITNSAGTDDAHQTINLTSTPTRFSITKTFSTDNTEIQIGVDNRGLAGGDTIVGSFYFWGGQLDIGSVATDYQMTGALVGRGNHALQSTTANKPYLRRTPTSGKYWYDSNTSTGALNATFASALGSACTIATVTPEGVTIAENQTVGTTYNIAPPYGYNSDVLIINRALTAAEKALVTRVMQRSVPTLGAELIPNGTFDAGITGWASVNAATLTLESGALKVTPFLGNNYGAASFIHPATVGSIYLAKVDISGVSNSSVQWKTSVNILSSAIRNGTYISCFIGSNSPNTIDFISNSTTSSPVYFDNVSVKEVF